MSVFDDLLSQYNFNPVDTVNPAQISAIQFQNPDVPVSSLLSANTTAPATDNGSQIVPVIEFPTPVVQQPTLAQSTSQRTGSSGFSTQKHQEVKREIPFEENFQNMSRRELEYAQPLLQSAYDQQSAAAEQAKAEAEVFNTQAAETLQQQNFLNKEAAAREQTVTKLRNDVDLALADLNTKRARAEQLEQQGVDRGRWWKNRSLGDKISVGLAAFIDGFMRPKFGNPNQMLQIVMKAVDDDVEAQVRDIELARAGVQAQRQEIQDLISNDQSLEVAREQFRAVKLQSLLKQAEVKVLQSQSKVKQAEGMQTVAAIRAKLAETVTNIKSRVFDENATKSRLQIERGRLALEREEMEMRNAAHLAKLLETQGLKTITNPQTGLAIGSVKPTFQEDKETVREVQNRTLAYANARSLASRYRAALRESGAVVAAGQRRLQSTETAELRGLWNDLLSQVILARTGKQSNQQELQRIEEFIPGPELLLQRSDAVAVLDQFLKSQDDEIMNTLRSYVDISDTSQLPVLIPQALDAAQPKVEGGFLSSGEESRVRELSTKARKEVLSSNEERELKGYIRMMLATASGEDLRSEEKQRQITRMRTILDNVPEGLRKVKPLDTRQGKENVDAYKVIKDIERKLEKQSIENVETPTLTPRGRTPQGYQGLF